MKDLSSCGYLQAPIKAVARQELERMGITFQSSGRRKNNKSHIPLHQVNNTQGENVSIYGRSLNELETRPVPGQAYLRVPRLLLRSCNFLSHHLSTEGLFRKSGSVARQKLIRSQLNDGKAIEEDSNPHDVANLLKQFLRELPEPLLTYEFYDGFIQTQLLELVEDQIHSMLLMALLLPDIQRHSLQFLVQFLHTCSLQSDVNKMTISNIAVVTSPNIMKHPSGDCSRMKMENSLMESLIENSSEVGLVTDELNHRAQVMLLELSTVWGISEEQAAYKLPLKGKRKRSGSISGMISNVFKHGNLKTTKRKSFSNQDLSELRGNHLLKNDLSCSTPCIKGQGTTGMHTPLLSAKRSPRRTQLLRQTPVDPRKKPKALVQSDNECESPIDQDPPKKRSKLDFSPQTEPQKERRMTMKERLSEGLRSRYRNDRIKQKRVLRNNTQLPTTPSIMKKVHKKKDKTPVFCFKAQPTSFKEQRRLSSGREVVVNHCTRYFESPACSPDIADYSPAQNSPEPFSDRVSTRSKTKVTVHGKKLFPAVLQVDSRSEDDSPKSQFESLYGSGEQRRNNSYLQSCHSVDMLTDLEPESGLYLETKPKTYLQQQIEETFSVRRSPRLRRSAPIVGSPFQVDLQKYRHRTSDSPAVRQSPRLSGCEPGPMLQDFRLKGVRDLPLCDPEPHECVRGLLDLAPKRRSVSGSSFTSFTAVKNTALLDTSTLHNTGLLDTPLSLTSPPSLNTSLDTSRGMAALITPSTFSRTSKASRSSSCGSSASSTRLSSVQNPFSPIPISLRNITPALTPPAQRSRHKSKEATSCSTNLFNSKELTRLDLSLNISDFDFQFKAPVLKESINISFPDTASSASDLLTDNILPDFTMNEAIAESTNINESKVTCGTENNESRITYITQNLSNFFPQNNTDLECPKFHAQIDGLPVSANLCNQNYITMVMQGEDPQGSMSESTKIRERLRSSERLKRDSFKSSDMSKGFDSFETPKSRHTVRMTTKVPLPGTPKAFAEVIEANIKNALVVEKGGEGTSGKQSQRPLASNEVSSNYVKSNNLSKILRSSKYLTRTSSECIRKNAQITEVVKCHMTQSNQSLDQVSSSTVSDCLVKPSFVLQDNHISSSSNVCDEVVQNKENKVVCITPTSNNNNEVDTTKINITPRTKINKGHTKQLANQWEDRSKTSTVKSTRNNKPRTVKSTRSKSADTKNRTKPTPTKKPAVKTKRTPKATPSRITSKTNSGDKNTPKPAWRF